MKSLKNSFNTSISFSLCTLQEFVDWKEKDFFKMHVETLEKQLLMDDNELEAMYMHPDFQELLINIWNSKKFSI